MYVFALFNSDSVKQNRNKHLTQQKYMANSTNVNITVKITLYIPVYSTILPLNLCITQNFLHFYIFNHSVRFICFIMGPKQYSYKVNLLVLLYLWGHLVPIIGNTSIKKHTASVCILFSKIELLLFTVYSNLKGVSTVPTLLPCIFLKILCNPFIIHVRKYVH